MPAVLHYNLGSIQCNAIPGMKPLSYHSQRQEKSVQDNQLAHKMVYLALVVTAVVVLESDPARVWFQDYTIATAT